MTDRSKQNDNAEQNSSSSGGAVDVLMNEVNAERSRGKLLSEGHAEILYGLANPLIQNGKEALVSSPNKENGVYGAGLIPVAGDSASSAKLKDGRNLNVPAGLLDTSKAAIAGDPLIVCGPKDRDERNPNTPASSSDGRQAILGGERYSVIICGPGKPEQEDRNSESPAKQVHEPRPAVLDKPLRFEDTVSDKILRPTPVDQSSDSKDSSSPSKRFESDQQGRFDDRAGSIGDRLSHRIDYVFPPLKDGVEKLSTGDYLVTKDGAQTIFTPSGNQLTINKDGTYSVKGDVREVSTAKDGSSKVTFADGSQINFDSSGIQSISKNGKTVEFLRSNKRLHDLMENGSQSPKIEKRELPPSKWEHRLDLPNGSPKDDQRNHLPERLKNLLPYLDSK